MTKREQLFFNPSASRTCGHASCRALECSNFHASNESHRLGVQVRHDARHAVLLVRLLGHFFESVHLVLQVSDSNEFHSHKENNDSADSPRHEHVLTPRAPHALGLLKRIHAPQNVHER
jgi:hypothetical protein